MADGSVSSRPLNGEQSVGAGDRQEPLEARSGSDQPQHSAPPVQIQQCGEALRVDEGDVAHVEQHPARREVVVDLVESAEKKMPTAGVEVAVECHDQVVAVR